MNSYLKYFHSSLTPPEMLDMRKRANLDGIIWQAISLANRRLTGCWKSKIVGGVSDHANLQNCGEGKWGGGAVRLRGGSIRDYTLVISFQKS